MELSFVNQAIQDLIAQPSSETLLAWLLPLSVLLPLGIAAVLLIPATMPRPLYRGLGLLGFLLPLAASCALWLAYSHLANPTGYHYLSTFPTGLEQFGITLTFGLNAISAPLFLMAGIVGFAAGFYAVFTETERQRSYLVLLLAMYGGVLGLFASVDIFFFYFFHEIALIPTFIAIGIWGNFGRRIAAMEMAIYLTLGAMLSLGGLLLLYLQSGAASFDFISLHAQLTANAPDALNQKWLLGILLFGFGILVSLWPLHSWAPRAYTASPASVVMIHAGILKKFGLYGLIQLALPLLPQGAAFWSGPLVFLALGNVLVIGLVTLAQDDVKSMASYSSVMHMGYVFLGLACLNAIGVNGALFLMFAHGLSAALLFLLIDCIQKRTGTHDMQQMGKLYERTPVLAGLFMVAILASVGLPGFANFWGEITVFAALWKLEPVFAVAAVLGIVISAVYGLRSISRIFFDPFTGPLPSLTQGNEDVADATGNSEADDKTAAAHPSTKGDLTMIEVFPAAVLILVLLMGGVFPQPISDTIHKTVSSYFPADSQPLPPMKMMPLEINGSKHYEESAPHSDSNPVEAAPVESVFHTSPPASPGPLQGRERSSVARSINHSGVSTQETLTNEDLTADKTEG